MPKKTAQTIVVGGNEYVLQVKGNRKFLLRDIKDHIKEKKADQIYQTVDRMRGRQEHRKVETYLQVTGKSFIEWTGLKTIIKVTRWGIRKKSPYRKEHFYISSHEDLSAKQFGEGIRSHWEIENNLHWVKDAILNEDGSLVKGNSLASNLSLIRNMVINLFRINNQPSIKYAIEKHQNRIKDCLKLLENIYIKPRSE